jgi:hypothetical protein
MTFRERKGFTTKDGHHYVSIPTPAPKTWHRWTRDDSVLTYTSSDYLIVRRPYGKSFGYDLKRLVDGEQTDLGPAYSRLKDAKAHAVRNAQGLDVFNWA